MIRITDDTKNDKPGLADCLAHRCEMHRHVPPRLEGMNGPLEAECGECVAVQLTYQYGLGLEEEKLALLDALSESLKIGAMRNRALWAMSEKVYEMIGRIRLLDPAWAEREYQTMTTEGALPPDRDVVTMMMNRYAKENPIG